MMIKNVGQFAAAMALKEQTEKKNKDKENKTKQQYEFYAVNSLRGKR